MFSERSIVEGDGAAERAKSEGRSLFTLSVHEQERIRGDLPLYVFFLLGLREGGGGPWLAGYFGIICRGGDIGDVLEARRCRWKCSLMSALRAARAGMKGRHRADVTVGAERLLSDTGKIPRNKHV